jgi:hypothetical protein
MLSDNRRLYDISTRVQVYTEGVKAQFAKEFSFVLFELREEFKKLLGRVQYKTLDGLTKAELTKLVLSLRASQHRIYSNYTEQVLKQLQEFMHASIYINRRAYVTARFELDTDKPEDQKPVSDQIAIRFIEDQRDFIPLYGSAAVTNNESRLWAFAHNEPIPANGLYLMPFLKTFSTSAQASIENIVRMAWANGTSVEETIALITGEDAKQGTSSQLQRIGVQNAAVTATAVQHIGTISAAAVASALFGFYGWFSVMDGKTSEICISRNLRIYRYGKGPLPPAHIRCRSHTSPVLENSDIAAESLYTWLAMQPQDVQDELLNGETIEEASATKFEARPLTIKEFRQKINLVLSR